MAKYQIKKNMKLAPRVADKESKQIQSGRAAEGGKSKMLKRVPMKYNGKKYRRFQTMNKK